MESILRACLCPRAPMMMLMVTGGHLIIDRITITIYIMTAQPPVPTIMCVSSHSAEEESQDETIV